MFSAGGLLVWRPTFPAPDRALLHNEGQATPSLSARGPRRGPGGGATTEGRARFSSTVAHWHRRASGVRIESTRRRKVKHRRADAARDHCTLLKGAWTSYESKDSSPRYMCAEPCAVPCRMYHCS